VLRERSFRRFFGAQAISLLGDGMVPVALAFAVLELTGSATDLGLVLAARTLPLVAFLLAGGVFADRLPRRALMITADVVRFASQGAMGALLLLGAPTVWMLAVLAAVNGTASAFFNPAMSGLLPMIVSPERLQHANALRSLAIAAGDIAGPLLAGVLVATVGAGWAMIADAATYGASAVLLAGVAVPKLMPPEARSFVSDLREGWREFTSRTWLWATVVTAAVGNAAFAAFAVLGPLVAQRSLGGAGPWSFIAASFGAGALAGGLIALRVSPSRPLAVGAVAGSLIALPLAMLAVTAPVPLIAVAALVSGAGLMLFSALWETTCQRHVTPTALSRVSAYDWFGSLAAQPVGFALWGPVAAAIGTSDALWLAFAVQFATCLALLTIPDLRRLPPAPLRPRTVATQATRS
jgi:MFS family permease